MFFVPTFSFSLALMQAYLGSETYTNQFVIFHFLHSSSHNVTCFRLMIANMTKTVMPLFGLEHAIQAIPILVNLLADDKQK